MTELPSGWVNTRLRQVCAINPRVNKNSIDSASVVSFVPMSAVEAETGKIDVSETRMFGDVRKGYRPFRAGDVLFAKITPCMENGKIGIVPDLVSEYGFGSTEFHVLRPAHGVDPRFICHAVSNRAFRSRAEHNMTGAVGQKRVPAAIVEEHEVAIPPTEEQRRIADRIDLLFDEIDQGVQSLRNARATIRLYRQSLLKSAFEGHLTADWRAQNVDKPEYPDGWPVRVNSNPMPRPSVEVRALLDAPLVNGRSVKEKRGGFPVLRLTAFKRGEIDLGESKEGNWSEADAEPFLVRQGDIFISRGNGSKKLVGIGGLVQHEPTPVAFPDTMIRVRLDRSAVRPEYFVLAWNSWTVRRQIEVAARTTAGIYKINQRQIRDFVLPLPSLAEQSEIVRILEVRLKSVDTLEEEIDANLARADALRQSILKKAFSGELVPQDHEDEPAHVLLARIRASREATSTTKPRRRARRRVDAATPP